MAAPGQSRRGRWAAADGGRWTHPGGVSRGRDGRSGATERTPQAGDRVGERRDPEHGAGDQQPPRQVAVSAIPLAVSSAWAPETEDDREEHEQQQPAEHRRDAQVGGRIDGCHRACRAPPALARGRRRRSGRAACRAARARDRGARSPPRTTPGRSATSRGRSNQPQHGGAGDGEAREQAEQVQRARRPYSARTRRRAHARTAMEAHAASPTWCSARRARPGRSPARGSRDRAADLTVDAQREQRVGVRHLLVARASRGRRCPVRAIGWSARPARAPRTARPGPAGARRSSAGSSTTPPRRRSAGHRLCWGMASSCARESETDRAPTSVQPPLARRPPVA